MPGADEYRKLAEYSYRRGQIDDAAHWLCLALCERLELDYRPQHAETEPVRGRGRAGHDKHL